MQHARGLAGSVASYHSLHRHGLYDQAFTLHQEGKPLAVSDFKARLNFFETTERHDQRGIAAFVADMDAPVHHGGARADLLTLQFSFSGGRQ